VEGWRIARAAGRVAKGTATGVVILGTGRSGTSAIARAFVAAGFFAGQDDQLLGASESNPRGHFEPLPVLEANELTLAELGSAWWAESPDPAAQREARGRLEPRLEAALAQIVGAAGERPVAVKEPRINSLLTLWAPLLDGYLHPVLAVRDPVEVAHSLARRDGISPAHALAAWEVHTTAVLDWLDGRAVTVAPFAELVERPELAAELVGGAAAQITPSRSRHLDPKAAPAALDPGLRHGNAADHRQADWLTERQAELWSFLASLPAGELQMRAPASARTPSLAATRALQAEGEHIRSATARAAELERLAEANARIGELSRSLERVEAERAAEIAGSAIWRITAPMRGLGGLARCRAASRRRRRPGLAVPPAEPAPDPGEIAAPPQAAALAEHLRQSPQTFELAAQGRAEAPLPRRPGEGADLDRGNPRQR
jgi:hypothetical protein